MKINIKTLSIEISFLHIHVSLFIFIALPLAALAGILNQFAIVFISVFLHELGHILIAFKKGGSLEYISLLPIGASAGLDTRNCPASSLIAIYAVGPAINMIVAVLSYFLYNIYKVRNDNLYFICTSNLYLAVFNLIPVLPLDGGRLLQEILKNKMGVFSSARFIRRITIIIAVAFILLGIFQVVSGSINISLLLIGSYMLLLIKSSRMEASLLNIRQIMQRRARLIERGSYPARGIVVIKGRKLNSILREMDYDRFHILYIVDDELKLLKIVTENEIIDAMVKCGGEITFEVFLENT